MTALIANDHPPTVVSWSCPDADLVLRADADRADWLTARTTGIGGSDISALAGVNAWSSPYEVWLTKTGRSTPKADPDRRMEMGRRLEPVIRECFHEATGIPVRRAGLMRSKAHPWMLASVDGLSGDGGGAEWKTTNWRMAHEWEDGQIADHAELQSQWYLAVTGRSHWWVAVMIDGGWPQFRRVERDEDLIGTLVGLSGDFWRNHVEADVAPPIGTPNALGAVKDRYARDVVEDVAAGDASAREAVDDWQAKKHATKTAAAQEKVAEAVVRELLGHHTGLAVHGETLITCKPNGAFSAAKFTKDHPDLAAQFQTMKPAIDTGRLQEAHPDLYDQYRARVLRPATTATTKGK